MIHFITLGFAPSRVLKKGLEAFYSTSTENSADYVHHYLNQHYPINKAENEGACAYIAGLYNMNYHDAGKNLGLHDGFNYVIDKIQLKPDDIIIPYDPDYKPLANGWDSALVDVVKDPRIGWATIMNPQSEREMKERGYEETEINGHRCWITLHAVTNITCAWKGDFIIKSKGVSEDRPFYGHLEAPMYQKLCSLDYAWAFVCGFPDSDEIRQLHDQDYTEYKWAHAHTQDWDGDFESWLKMKGKL